MNERNEATFSYDVLKKNHRVVGYSSESFLMN
jgi:hypothetical protein